MAAAWSVHSWAGHSEDSHIYNHTLPTIAVHSLLCLSLSFPFITDLSKGFRHPVKHFVFRHQRFAPHFTGNKNVELIPLFVNHKEHTLAQGPSVMVGSRFASKQRPFVIRLVSGDPTHSQPQCCPLSQPHTHTHTHTHTLRPPVSSHTPPRKKSLLSFSHFISLSFYFSSYCTAYGNTVHTAAFTPKEQSTYSIVHLS